MDSGTLAGAFANFASGTVQALAGLTVIGAAVKAAQLTLRTLGVDIKLKNTRKLEELEVQSERSRGHIKELFEENRKQSETLARVEKGQEIQGDQLAELLRISRQNGNRPHG